MGRLSHLDAMRGLAVLAVVIQHCAEIAGYALDWFNGGRFGVTLFFLLSGFVIPFSFSGDRPVNRFLITRFFRLYPAFWASLLVATLVSPVSPAEFLANASMAPILFGQPLAVGAYWTLFYELCFYGLCVALFVKGMETRHIGILAICLVPCLLLPRPVGEVGFIGIMLTGTLIRRAVLDHDGQARKWAAAVTAIYVAMNLYIMSHGALQEQVAGLAALGLFLLIIRLETRSPPLEWLGKISYSLYLFHGVALLAMPMLPPALFIVSVIALSTGIAAVSYYLIEDRFNQLGRRLAQRPPKPAEAVAG